MSTPLTSTNNSALGLLSNYRLRVRQDATGSYVDNYDMHLFLQKYVGLLGFTGQFAQTTIDFSNSGSQLLARWDNITIAGGGSIFASFLNTFTIRVGSPFVTQDEGAWQYKLIVNLSSDTGSGVAFTSRQASMTMINANLSYSSALDSALSSFQLNYYVSDNHIELGINFAAVAGATKPALVSVYVDPPTAFDGVPYSSTVSGAFPSSIPTLNTVNSTPFTASPTISMPLDLYDAGTSKNYIFAVTSGAAVGTTQGFEV